MDYNRLQRLFLNNTFTDLRLILKDFHQEIILDVHRVVLIAHSAYFEKLLTFGNRPSEITIDIPDASVARDIILSFYGQQTSRTNIDWAYELSLAKCLDYFGLELSMPEIPKVIEAKDFDAILQLCELNGFDEDSLCILTKNLPEDYDLSILSKELVAKMIEVGTIHIITSYENDSIHLRNIYTSEIIYTFKHDKEKINDLHISKDRRFFASKSINECCIWSVIDGLIYKSEEVIKMDFSSDYVHFAMACVDTSIKIYDLIQRKIVKVLDFTTSSITFIKFSFCGKYLASGHLNKTLKIWLVNNGQYLNTIETLYDVKEVNFSKDSTIITIEDSDGKQQAWKIMDLTNIIPIENIICISNHIYRYWEMSTTDVLIAHKCFDGIKILDGHTASYINFFDNKCNSLILFSTNNKYIVLTQDGKSDLFEITSGKNLCSFQKGMVLFSPNNKYFVVKIGRFLQIFNIETNTISMHQNRQNDHIVTFGFLRNSDLLLYECKRQVILYNIVTDKIINIFDANLFYAGATHVYTANALRLLEIIE